MDASVVIAGLFKDGTVRDVLLNSGDISFHAPAYVREEVTRHLAEVASRAGIPIQTVEAVLEDLLGAMELAPAGVYATSLDSARSLAKTAAMPRDAEYVALALALGAPVWTLDRDFGRIPRLRVLTTREVADL